MIDLTEAMQRLRAAKGDETPDAAAGLESQAQKLAKSIIGHDGNPGMSPAQVPPVDGGNQYSEIGPDGYAELPGDNVAMGAPEAEGKANIEAARRQASGAKAAPPPELLRSKGEDKDDDKDEDEDDKDSDGDGDGGKKDKGKKNVPPWMKKGAAGTAFTAEELYDLLLSGADARESLAKAIGESEPLERLVDVMVAGFAALSAQVAAQDGVIKSLRKSQDDQGEAIVELLGGTADIVKSFTKLPVRQPDAGVAFIGGQARGGVADRAPEGTRKQHVSMALQKAVENGVMHADYYRVLAPKLDRQGPDAVWAQVDQPVRDLIKAEVAGA